MDRLSKNFVRSEFACECGCGFDTVDIELLEALQECVSHFDREIDKGAMLIITGGNRCARHNTAQRELYKTSKGKKGSHTALNSQHIYGRAADFKVFTRNEEGKKDKQISPEIIATWFEKNFPRLSIGRYNNRTHVDSRSDGPIKWDERN